MKKYIAQILTKIKSKGRYRQLSLMKEYEYKPVSECRYLQKELLFNILKYSTNNVIYYREIGRINDIQISKDNIFNDIKKFPILSKEILRSHFDDLKSKNFEGEYHKNTSGGSTGEPVVFLQDTYYNEKSKGSKIFFYEWAGRKDGEKIIKLWGSEKDILEGSQGINGWIMENLLNIKLLNTFRMSENDMKKYVDIINKGKPKIIEAYVQSIYEFSKFIKNNCLRVYSPKGIIASAGTLYPEYQKLIEEVFRTKVYNRYGSREVGEMAVSCEKDEGLHLNIFNQYIEILDDNLEPCKPGEIGHVYVTTLNNYVMPLIRYQIGDMAIPAKKEQCSCGRGLPLIEKVIGRNVNLFKEKNGALIDGEYFTHLIYYRNWIKRFQVVQKEIDLIKIYIVLNNGKNESDMKDITEKIKIVMGVDCNVEFEFVKDIEPAKSGKYSYTISEIK